MKNIFLGSFVCLSAAGCHIKDDHFHPLPPPPFEEFQTCTITHDYRPNAAQGAIEPVVTCSVRDADSTVQASCYMEFRAFGSESLSIVTDQQYAPTDFLGDTELVVSNGNCYEGETIVLYAECIVNGERLQVLDTGRINCGN